MFAASTHFITVAISLHCKDIFTFRLYKAHQGLMKIKLIRLNYL
jgi:hypothetical protein